MFSLIGNCFSWLKRRKEPIKKVTLLMVGLDNAGKTSTVADLKGDTLEGITPTVGFLSSSFPLYRYNVTIYDLGGGSRIRGIWTNYFAEAYGIVFVVDASDRQRLEECKDVLHESMNSDKIYGKPLLILANKQDITGALTEQEVYEQLDIGSFIARNKCLCQVFSCTAVLGQGNKIDRQIKKGFQWLLQEISQNFNSISQRVERDYSEQKRIVTEERKKKLARIRREKEERERAQKEAAEKAASNENEDSDDDVVVGKDVRRKDTVKDTDRDSPIPTKTKKRSKKKQHKENVTEDSTPLPETQQDNSENTEEIITNRISARGRLAPLEHSTPDTDSKKKKKKKKKRKNNKTAPIDEDMELPQKNTSSLAWGEPTPAGSNAMNGLAGAPGRRLQPITRPVISDSRNIPSSDQESDEDPKPLAPTITKSWTRTRPNSEDHDLVT